ncbi:hypothetical protein MTR_3g052960 [Medicago truncatula]|uniref:Uncharacterized protein n=1 Tax=Medicago truncatula TaxID=3880 RepID=A0A072UVN9_MEDTR|nr:hypothetical protein MTR_3g052960 [Medicago truncatula]
MWNWEECLGSSYGVAPKCWSDLTFNERVCKGILQLYAINLDDVSLFVDSSLRL